MRWPTPLAPIIIAKLLGGNGQGGGSVTPALANALLDWCAHTAFTDQNGQTYYDNLLNALYPVQSIAAVYTQSGTVYSDDSLDSLKSDLVVTATYENGGTETVPSSDYTLSGTLTVGTSTVTVTYKGKTDTFTVTVSEQAALHYELSENDLSRNVELTKDNPYSGIATTRISYTPFDLLVEGGKSYRIVAVSTYNTAQMGLQCPSQAGLARVSSQASLIGYLYDPGWQTLDTVVTLPDETAAIRITFRQDARNTTIADDFKITSVTIDEVTE